MTSWIEGAFDALEDGLCVFESASGRLLHANAAYRRLLPTPQLQAHWGDWLEPECRRDAEAAVESNGRHTVALMHRLPNGEAARLELTVSRLAPGDSCMARVKHLATPVQHPEAQPPHQPTTPPTTDSNTLLASAAGLFGCCPQPLCIVALQQPLQHQALQQPHQQQQQQRHQPEQQQEQQSVHRPSQLLPPPQAPGEHPHGHTPTAAASCPPAELLRDPNDAYGTLLYHNEAMLHLAGGDPQLLRSAGLGLLLLRRRRQPLPPSAACTASCSSSGSTAAGGGLDACSRGAAGDEAVEREWEEEEQAGARALAAALSAGGATSVELRCWPPGGEAGAGAGGRRSLWCRVEVCPLQAAASWTAGGGVRRQEEAGSGGQQEEQQAAAGGVAGGAGPAARRPPEWCTLGERGRGGVGGLGGSSSSGGGGSSNNNISSGTYVTDNNGCTSSSSNNNSSSSSNNGNNNFGVAAGSIRMPYKGMRACTAGQREGCSSNDSDQCFAQQQQQQQQQQCDGRQQQFCEDDMHLLRDVRLPVSADERDEAGRPQSGLMLDDMKHHHPPSQQQQQQLTGVSSHAGGERCAQAASRRLFMLVFRDVTEERLRGQQQQQQLSRGEQHQQQQQRQEEPQQQQQEEEEQSSTVRQCQGAGGADPLHQPPDAAPTASEAAVAAPQPGGLLAGTSPALLEALAAAAAAAAPPTTTGTTTTNISTSWGCDSAGASSSSSSETCNSGSSSLDEGVVVVGGGGERAVGCASLTTMRGLGSGSCGGDVGGGLGGEPRCCLHDLALGAVKEGITISDPSAPDHPIVYTNQAFLDMTGYSREEVLGRNCRFLQGPDTDPAAVQAIRDALGRCESVSVQLLNYTKTGSRFWNELRLAPVRHPRTGQLVAYIGVQNDVSELLARKQSEARLRDAKEAAESATQAKSQFLANMSHEIRTPLNGMIATTQLLLASLLNPEQRELAETLLESGCTLLGILGDILDFSKIDHGSLELQRRPMCLRQATEACIELVAAEAAKKGLALAYLAADEALERPLLGDPVRVRQVLANLLSNAVKFTERGEVVVRVGVEKAAHCRNPHEDEAAARAAASSSSSGTTGAPAAPAGTSTHAVAAASLSSSSTCTAAAAAAAAAAADPHDQDKGSRDGGCQGQRDADADDPDGESGDADDVNNNNEDNNDNTVVHISVTDTGIGISEESARKLFQHFRQGSETMSRRYGGTGLGLVISKRLAQLMHGDVWVESQPGRGSTFHFTLRAEWAAAATPWMYSPARSAGSTPTQSSDCTPRTSTDEGNAGSGGYGGGSSAAGGGGGGGGVGGGCTTAVADGAPSGRSSGGAGGGSSSRLSSSSGGSCGGGGSGGSGRGPRELRTSPWLPDGTPIDSGDSGSLPSPLSPSHAAVSSTGRTSSVAADERAVLLGRSVLVDVTHAATSTQVWNSCRQMGLVAVQAATGSTTTASLPSPSPSSSSAAVAAVVDPDSAARPSSPSPSPTASSLSLFPAIFSSTLATTDATTPTSISTSATPAIITSAVPSQSAAVPPPQSYDILVVSMDRLVSALKAGWKGRPVVALGDREQLPPALQPLVVVTVLPVKHSRLVTALVKATALLRWNGSSAPKLGNAPIPNESIQTLKSWRLKRGSDSEGINRRTSLDNSALERAAMTRAGGPGAAAAAAAAAAVVGMGVGAGAGLGMGMGLGVGVGVGASGVGLGLFARGGMAGKCTSAVQQAPIPEHDELPAVSDDLSGARALLPAPSLPPNGYWSGTGTAPQLQQAGPPSTSAAAAITAAAPAATAAPSSVTPAVSAAGAEGQQQQQASLQHLRILIAEDNKINQKVVLKVLQRILPGSQPPDVVENGVQVLQALQKKTYDLILMDIHMPEMDGLEASRRIQELFKPEERPRIIALSADTVQTLHDRCREAGIEAFLVKPFRIEELARVMRTGSAGVRRPSTLETEAANRGPALIA